MTVLHSAYNLLFCRPQHYHEWEMAKEIIDNFDVRIFGEELSAKVLCLIFHQEYIRKAEEKMPELFGAEPEHEFHMDEIAVIENMFNNGVQIKEIRKMYRIKFKPPLRRF